MGMKLCSSICNEHAATIIPLTKVDIGYYPSFWKIFYTEEVHHREARYDMGALELFSIISRTLMQFLWKVHPAGFKKS